MKIVNFSILFIWITFLDINFINTYKSLLTIKNKLKEGLKITENSKEASKESAKSKEGIEIEMEKHRMKMRNKMRNKKRIPKMRNLVTENLLANTARYILDHGLEKSVIENNNSRYNILSAKEAKDNQELSKPKIKENEKEAYYGGESLMDLNKNLNYVTVSDNKKKSFTDNIYQNDRMPYYGPTNYKESSKITIGAPKDKFLTPIEIKDLSDVTDSYENKKRLENEINDINKSYLNNNDQVYKRDPLAYYDPTVEDKENKKTELKSALEQVKNDMNIKEPVFTEENFKVQQKIQNYKNLNQEKDNNFIRDNNWVDTKNYDKKTIYTYFDIGVEVNENKHKVVNAYDQSQKSDKYYYPSKNKKYEADEVLNENIAEKTSTRLDGKVEADGWNVNKLIKKWI